MRVDLGEEVHLYQAVELAGGDFVLEAEFFEERLVEEFGGGDSDADALGRETRVDVSI